MKIKQFCRRIIRSMLGSGKEESVRDGVNRKLFRIKRRLDKRQVSLDEFKDCLSKAGINKGDTVIVHASWRGCYMLKATPEEVINSLLQCVGEEGTLLMPCYGSNRDFLDVKKTPSQAGVLSECFRNYSGVMRSLFPQATMCGKGKHAHELLSGHEFSKYGFDEKSPYYKATIEKNGKILLLGMGKNPDKISVFHCATYASKDDTAFYKQVYSKLTEARVIDEQGVERRIDFFDRTKPYSNNHHMFRKLFKKVPQRRIIYNGFILTSFNGREAYNVAKEFCRNGGKLYKTH